MDRDRRDKKSTRRRVPKDGCWVCDTTGRVRAQASRKSIPCKECKGRGIPPAPEMEQAA